MNRFRTLIFTILLGISLLGCNLTTTTTTASTTTTTTTTVSTTLSTSTTTTTISSITTTIDQNPPQFTGVDDVSIYVGTAFNPMTGVNALDAEDGDVTSSISVNGVVNSNQPGNYTLTYTVEDRSGNLAEAIRVVSVVLKPLDAAILAYEESTSLTMSLLFVSGTESNLMLVQMDQTAMKVEVLDETVYYEIDGETCYYYEFVEETWSKSTVECSEKGTLELQFLTNFSSAYFVEQTIDQQVVYVLKMEYYASLQLFLGSTITSNFRMTLSEGLIQEIRFTMIRNSITFDMTITLSDYNETAVTLPEVTNP